MPETPPGVLVTTGICPRCAAKLLAELDHPQPTPQPFEPRGGTYYGHYGV